MTYLLQWLIPHQPWANLQGCWSKGAAPLCKARCPVTCFDCYIYTPGQCCWSLMSHWQGHWFSKKYATGFWLMTALHLELPHAIATWTTLFLTAEMLKCWWLLQHPKFKKEWNLSATNEFGQLAQDRVERVEGTNTISSFTNQNSHKIDLKMSLTFTSSPTSKLRKRNPIVLMWW